MPRTEKQDMEDSHTLDTYENNMAPRAGLKIDYTTNLETNAGGHMEPAGTHGTDASDGMEQTDIQAAGVVNIQARMEAYKSHQALRDSFSAGWQGRKSQRTIDLLDNYAKNKMAAQTYDKYVHLTKRYVPAGGEGEVAADTHTPSDCDGQEQRGSSSEAPIVRRDSELSRAQYLIDVDRGQVRACICICMCICVYTYVDDAYIHVWIRACMER